MPLKRKRCPKCSRNLPLSKFHANVSPSAGPLRLQSYCKPCATKDSRERYHKNPTIKRTQAIFRERVRREAFLAYGDRCSCPSCPMNRTLEPLERMFLGLDHVLDDGKEHRKSIAAGYQLYLWARRNGYPQTLRLLCHNCNLARSLNSGVCPHYGIHFPGRVANSPGYPDIVELRQLTSTLGKMFKDKIK